MRDDQRAPVHHYGLQVWEASGVLWFALHGKVPEHAVGLGLISDGEASTPLAAGENENLFLLLESIADAVRSDFELGPRRATRAEALDMAHFGPPTGSE